MSKIEWTEETWNPLIGCTKVSAGCKNCYAIQTAWIRMHNPKMAERYAGTVEKTAGGQLNWTGRVNQVHEALDKPLKFKKPTIFFVNSMSDLFHPAVDFQYVQEIWHRMKACPQHTFQILTKQFARMLEYMTDWASNAYGSPFEPLPNVWLGVSVEDQKAADERIPILLQVPAAIRFLSCEPLLGPVDLTAIKQTVAPGFFGDCLQWYHRGKCHEDEGLAYPKIDWVIAGGESGPNARPMHPDWARSLRDQCEVAGVAFHFKQWGEWRLYDHYAGDNAKPLGMFEDNVFRTGNIVWDHKKESVHMAKVGKQAAGRILDGSTHDEFPQAVKPI